jgi:hypothetical protein
MISDHDLEKLFKLEQEHSVLAACRAIFELGYKHARDELHGGGHLVVDPEHPVTDPVVHPVTTHAINLIDAAKKT